MPAHNLQLTEKLSGPQKHSLLSSRSSQSGDPDQTMAFSRFQTFELDAVAPIRVFELHAHSSVFILPCCSGMQCSLFDSKEILQEHFELHIRRSNILEDSWEALQEALQ